MVYSDIHDYVAELELETQVRLVELCLIREFSATGKRLLLESYTIRQRDFWPFLTNTIHLDLLLACTLEVRSAEGVLECSMSASELKLSLVQAELAHAGRAMRDDVRESVS